MALDDGLQLGFYTNSTSTVSSDTIVDEPIILQLFLSKTPSEASATKLILIAYFAIFPDLFMSTSPVSRVRGGVWSILEALEDSQTH